MAPHPEIKPSSESPAPLGGRRSEAVQRLQVGASLLAGVVLLVGLANVIEDRAKETDAASVPEAAATETAAPTPAAQRDPLADAGVVPDLPAEPKPTSTGERPILPEQGDAAQPR